MKNNTILIVDDNTTNVKVLGNLLKGNGYQVEFALDGKSAIDWIMKKDFDLILLDVMMPEMDGFEVAAILKDAPQKKDIPIIFLTAKSDEESILKGFKSGGVDFLTKPFNHSELLARVSTHVALKNAREEIKMKNRQIMESLHYAQLIQRALLPSEKLNKSFPNNFIVYLPKDIVSGDFYWINDFGSKIALVVADCTGHGIPGAFMSVLGITLLNEMISSINTIESNEILDTLRTKIKSLLGQNVEEMEDGMDLSLCLFDMNKMEVQYSGAQSVIFLVRDDLLLEYKGDRQPVGAWFCEEQFTYKTIKVEKNDIIYLFSDGIRDQFGGKNDRKLGSRLLKKLILKVNNEKMPIQGQKIRDFIEKWKGDFEQTDDIIVLGIQI